MGRRSVTRSKFPGSGWSSSSSTMLRRLLRRRLSSSPRLKRQSTSQWRLRTRPSMKWQRTCMPETLHAQNDRELTFARAIREALAEEMRRDATVCIMGEDVAEAGTPFKVLSGLLEEFGKDRVLDTPVSETGFTGLAVGSAMTGLTPVVHTVFARSHPCTI